MKTIVEERVEAARRGINPTVIYRMPSGWAVLGDTQFLRGYSLLLADPVVADINALPEENRIRFLLDMVLLGDALLAVTGAYRINYEILGNTEAALHAHVFPRYLAEPQENRRRPAWFYESSLRNAAPFDPVRDEGLKSALAEAIRQRLPKE